MPWYIQSVHRLQATFLVALGVAFEFDSDSCRAQLAQLHNNGR